MVNDPNKSCGRKFKESKTVFFFCMIDSTNYFQCEKKRKGQQQSPRDSCERRLTKMLRDAEEKRKSERKKNKKTKRNEVIGQRILRDWNIHVLDKSYIYIIYIRVIKFFLSPTSVYGCFSQQNDIIYSKARPSKTSKICVPIHMRIILPRGFFHSLKKKKKK